MHMRRLEGKVAIITGAARGVGQCAAKMFLQDGAKVVATSRKMENLSENLKDVACDDLLLVQHDVSSEEDWNNVVNAAMEKFGKVDVLVNNAGIILGKSVEDETLEEWNKVLATSATGPFLGIQKCSKVMKPGSSIINMASIAGLRGGARTGNDAAYNAAKGGERLLTKHAAHTLGPKGIRVNSIHPGAILTDMLKMYMEMDPNCMNATAEQAPLAPHYSTPEDISYLLIFLASDESKSITGAEIAIDNGLSSF